MCFVHLTAFSPKRDRTVTIHFSEALIQLRPPCDGTPSASVWSSPRQTAGPPGPYSSDRTLPDATMKPVDAPHRMNYYQTKNSGKTAEKLNAELKWSMRDLLEIVFLGRAFQFPESDLLVSGVIGPGLYQLPQDISGVEVNGFLLQ